MAAAATIILVNGLAANVNYYPQRVVSGDQVTYVDRTNAIIAAQSKASVFHKETATTRKVTGKVFIPTIDAVTNAVLRTALGTFELIAALGSTEAERTDLQKRLGSLVNHAVVTSSFVTGERVW